LASVAVLNRLEALPTVQLQHVESVEEDVPVIAAIAQPVEYWHPVPVAAHCLPIN